VNREKRVLGDRPNGEVRDLHYCFAAFSAASAARASASLRRRRL
jgi:hypothetical protein